MKKKTSLYKVPLAVFSVLVLLLVILVILSAATKTTVEQSRADGDYTVITDVSYAQIREDSAPNGVVNECLFTLGEIGHADTLAFYINHNNIEVYLADECVYTLTASEGAICTPGGYWSMIPLYTDDTGKEVRVVLTPLYSDYLNEKPTFLLGSELAIYRSRFLRALPESVLCVCVILAGLFLLLIAAYNSIKRDTVFRLYSLGLLALSAGLWRFTYGNFAYLLFADYTVLVYTLSIISLMLLSLAMITFVDPAKKRKSRIATVVCSVCYCAVYIVQLILQIAGVFDLRQMLKITHVLIIIGAAVLCFNSIRSWVKPSERAGKWVGRNYSWLLGIGTLADLVMYYFAEDSFDMIFTLCAILCFSLLEGFQLLISYTEQKYVLEEMETRLTLSRTATMMSQIRSHFVFNLLNAISGMCKYDPEKADDTVVRFARYLRNNIDIMEDDKNIPFDTDLRQLEDYVALEQVRFGDKIEFYTDIETDRFMIPPLILQPVVENAIKHGISKKRDNGTIILRTRDTGGNIVITVEDDGVGFDMAELNKETSVGLKNIRFRLHHLVDGTMDIASELGKGTTVTITIPKKETD